MRTLPAPGSVTVHLQEVYSNADVGSVQVEACQEWDELCIRPFARAESDASGRATLSMPGGLAAFSGYLRVTGSTLVDNYVFFRGRAPSTPAGEVDVPICTRAMLGVTGTLAGVKPDPQLGFVRVDAHDCANAAASRITVALQASGGSAHVDYFVGDGANVSPDADLTDATGVAVAFDVPPGPISASSVAEGRYVGAASGFAYAGGVTSLVVHPDNAHPAGSGMPITSCCTSGSVTACCDDLREGDLVMYDATGGGTSPVGCWGGGANGATCTAGTACAMRIHGQPYEGVCSAP